MLRSGSLTAAAGILCCSENLSTGVTGCSDAVLGRPNVEPPPSSIRRISQPAEQPTITPTSQLMITIDAVVTVPAKLRRSWPEFGRASCDHQGRDHERGENATQGCLGASAFRTPWVHLEVEVFGYGSRGTSAWPGEDQLQRLCGDSCSPVTPKPSSTDRAFMSLHRSIAIATPSWELT